MSPAPPTTRFAAGRVFGRPAVVLGALLFLEACAGCSTLSQVISSSSPTARIRSVRLAGLTLETARLEFNVEASNPLPVAVPALSLDYALDHDGAAFLEGSSSLDGNIPASGSRTVTVPLEVDLMALVRVVANLRPGEIIDYTARLGLYLDVPGVGRTGIPMSRSGQLPVPAPPTVSAPTIRWEELSVTAVRGVLDLDIRNPNAFSFDLNGLTYSLDLAGRPLVTGKSRPGTTFPARGAGSLSIPFEASTLDLGFSFIQILQGGQTDYAIEGGLELGTRFGELTPRFRTSGKVDMLR